MDINNGIVRANSFPELRFSDVFNGPDISPGLGSGFKPIGHGASVSSASPLTDRADSPSSISSSNGTSRVGSPRIDDTSPFFPWDDFEASNSHEATTNNTSRSVSVASGLTTRDVTPFSPVGRSPIIFSKTSISDADIISQTNWQDINSIIDSSNLIMSEPRQPANIQTFYNLVINWNLLPELTNIESMFSNNDNLIEISAKFGQLVEFNSSLQEMFLSELDPSETLVKTLNNQIATLRKNINDKNAENLALAQAEYDRINSNIIGDRNESCN